MFETCGNCAIAILCAATPVSSLSVSILLKPVFSFGTVLVYKLQFYSIIGRNINMCYWLLDCEENY